MNEDFSKKRQILRDKYLFIKDEIISCMSSEVISKIYKNELTPDEIAGIYIYKKLIDEQNNVLPGRHLENPLFINAPSGLKIIRLILNDNKSEIIDIEFKEIRDNK